MGVYQRPDSPMWWMLLERRGQKAKRESTGIPVDGGNPATNRDLKAQAQEVYATRMTDLARRRFNLPVSLPSRTFHEHADWYIEKISSTKGGTLKEISMLRQLRKFFGALQLSAVTKEDGLNWRAERAEDVEESTVNREMALLKHVFTTAVPKYIEESPLAGLQELEPDDVEMRILEPHEETALLKACQSDEERALIVCGLDTLQRLGSVTALRWVDDRGDQLRFMNPKVRSGTRKGHHVEISTRLRRLLERVKKRAPVGAERVFRSFWDADEQRRRNLVWKMMIDRCTAAGIQTNRLEGGISFHALRHTGATRMLQRGVDPKTVMVIGGWKRIEQVLKYIHSNAELQRAAVNQVGRRPAPAKTSKRKLLTRRSAEKKSDAGRPKPPRHRRRATSRR